jgi:threonine/homoserine/homoserine lactone efflux protein
MSPGPSLAVVLKHTLSGGRHNGYLTAITHGVGIGLYALLAISGLAVLITTSPTLHKLLQWGGAAYLAWLGVKLLFARSQETDLLNDTPTRASAALDGFMIAFLNPKVAVFFIALFSQVIGSDTSLAARLGYAATALFIDMAWYMIVAWLFSAPRWFNWLQKNSVWFERVFGLILLALAGRLLLSNLL